MNEELLEIIAAIVVFFVLRFSRGMFKRDAQNLDTVLEELEECRDERDSLRRQLDS